MSDQQFPDDKDFENDLKSYFNLTTGAEVPGGVQRMDAGKYSEAKPAAAKRLMSGIGLVLAGAVAVGAVVTIHGAGTHTTPSLAATPSIVDGAAIAYDPAIKKVVLFGGTNASGHDLSDTWTWDGSSWTLMATPTSPSARAGASLGWDPSSQRLVLTGGTVASNAPTSTTCSTGAVPPGFASGGTTAGGSASGQATGGGVVVNGSGAASSISVAPGATPPPVPSGAATSGSISVSGSGIVTSKGFGGCAVTGDTSLSDTWSFDGTTWHQEHPTTKPAVSFGRALMATDNTTQSLVLVAQSFAPVPLTANTSACPVPAPATAATAPSTCATFAGPTNDVYVWRDGNWVADGTLPGNVTALATDPSTGDVTAIMAPEFAFACGQVSVSSASPSTTIASGTATSTAIATAPCPASAQALKPTTSPAAKLMEWSGGKWTAVGATGGPTSPIASAVADSGTGYLLVLTADGESWSFALNTWTKLAASGPPSSALGLALLADDPAAANGSGQVVMFLPAPGLVAAPDNGSAALIQEQPKGATSDATWIWLRTWKQVSGGAWPTPSTTDLPAPVPCPAAAANAPSPPPGAVTVCNGGGVSTGPSITIQPAPTP